MIGALRAVREAGFTLLPVVLSMSLVAAVAFLLNRDNGMNAEMISSQSDTDRARYAAEAGLQAANYQIQQRDCNGGYPTSGSPVTNNNFGGASYSAYASSSSGNVVALTSTGSYNGTTVTLTRSNVQAYKKDPVTNVTLQPGTTATSYDTYISASSTGNNYGGDSPLRLTNSNYEMLLKFDFSSLPAGFRAVPSGAQYGASLKLHQSNATSSAGMIGAYLITHSWSPGTKTGPGSPDGATWNTYDGTNAWPSPGVGYDATQIGDLVDFSSKTGDSWYSWDITAAVVAWMNSGLRANYGIWLRTASGTVNNAQYDGDDSSTASNRPKVVVNYLAPC